MEGKAPKWWKEMQAKKNGSEKKLKKRGSANAFIGEDNSGSNSCTAFIESESGTGKFKKIFRSCHADGDISCMAVEIEDKCSIEWNQDTTRNAPPNAAEEQASIVIPKDPFYIDSGTTSHCSPHKLDFTELKSILPRTIGGSNRMSIATVGRGKICLRCRKGRRLTLKDTLCPQGSTPPDIRQKNH
jgi:hypothetical protein